MDRPQVLSVVPWDGAEVRVHNRTVLTCKSCKADANPELRYQWLQMVPPSKQTITRSSSSELVLESVSYTVLTRVNTTSRP